MDSYFSIRTRAVIKLLATLKEDTATGPDSIPAVILKKCAKVLGLPVAMLCRAMYWKSCWPEIWRLHWIVPIYKRNSPSIPTNYRGVHLTPILSKVAEKILGTPIIQFLEETDAWGDAQFAFRKGRSSKDVLALVTSQWVLALVRRLKIAIYCGDIAGAFDRVKTLILLMKSEHRGLCDESLGFLESYFKPRKAVIVVGGEKSKAIKLENTVYQGSVLGPPLWNTHFADIAKEVQEATFNEVIYADDLNAFKTYQESLPNDLILDELTNCAKKCHAWGDKNQVEFEPTKEHFIIVHKKDPYGKSFKLLGAVYDTKLIMDETVHKIVTSVGWKLKMLFRMRSYFVIAKFVTLYKSQIWSSLEWATPAIFHASKTILDSIDKIQSKFLKFEGISEIEGFVHFNIAPLALRRKIAILGLLHRCARLEAPKQLCDLFPRIQVRERANNTRFSFKPDDVLLMDRTDGMNSTLLNRSIFGMVRFYNRLPKAVKATKLVSTFQGKLQDAAIGLCKKGMDIDDVISLKWLEFPLKKYAPVFNTN